ncbi:multi-sensor signal transduction histidine kinase [Pedosphaera parvula Ellin514]|uniref:histidine kinase n=2 Tax=Pedosphaera TaxID=1032526 RepID=B9XHP2_PEDPL|nr:multi-sensor signal transduction histidine kinase [Pedosphaera parvula Ellin514]
MLRSVALQNAGSTTLARDRAEAELLQARASLEERTKELAQQRECFQVALSSIGDAVITADTEGKVTFLNPVAETMTGWKSSEATGQLVEKVFNIINEQTRQPVTNPVHKVLKIGVIVGPADHATLIARDGRETAIEDSAAPIRDATGGCSGAVMVFHDVTGRRSVEAALRRSRDQFSAILNVALDAIITMDHKGKVSDFNPAAERIFGYRRDDILGRPIAELIIPERLRQRHYEGLSRYLATGEGPVLGKRIEMPALRADGQEFPVELSICRIAHSEPPIFTATLRDITERKQEEKALVERARLAALRADIGIALAGSENSQSVLQRCSQALVTQLDAAFARIWTVNEAESVLELQASAGIYTHLNGPHGRVKIGEYKIGRIAQNHQPLLTNDVLHDPNISDPVWARREGMVAFAGYPLVLEGKALGVMAMFARHPLSENVMTELAPIADGLAQWVRRKRVEEALRKAQQELQHHASTLEATVEERTAELREKIGELEAFSYSVSHDMRAPLRAMQGYATTLLEDHKQDLPEAAQQYLDRIYKSATRMDLLIQAVLTYSKVAKEPLILHPVDMETLIADVRHTYPALQTPKAIITIKGSLPRVLGHEVFLSQVISNLLSNAVKFVVPGVTPEINIHADQTEGFVRIWFEDNGIGIDSAHYHRIFEMFGGVHADKKFEGTGIGLTIVKKAVERMGGEIGVESQPDQGSRFWFTLKKANDSDNEQNLSTG